MTTTKTPLEMSQLELAALQASRNQIISNYDSQAAINLTNKNVQLARKDNEIAAKESLIATLEAGE